jgi:predicted alpha/beta superfamily hydrolase
LAEQRRARDEGRLHLHPKFPSKFLSTRRDLIVYVPPGYAETDGRYPVLYMQDGQNLFDPATAFLGQDWGADITADEMIGRGEISPPIIVGIYNSGTRRMSEYAPTRDQRHRKGGKADRYAEMMAREIKPFIDHEYRTLKPAKYTAVAGSSLGGLVSLVAGLKYPRVFGALAVISPSVWWDHRSILRWVHQYTEATRPRMWVDVGTAEGSGPQHVVEDARALRDALVAKGWSLGDDLSYHEIDGADHSERAWAARFGAVLAYLFPPQI